MLDDTISGFIQIVEWSIRQALRRKLLHERKTGYRLNSDSIGGKMKYNDTDSRSAIS